jgi:chromosome segregation ATPase
MQIKESRKQKANKTITTYLKDIDKLKRKLQQLQVDQENDPDVELSGGKNADKYGSKMNNIEKELNNLLDKIEKLKATPKYVFKPLNKIAVQKDYEFYPVIQSLN